MWLIQFVYIPVCNLQMANRMSSDEILAALKKELGGVSRKVGRCRYK